jgi:hypothetical protein
MIRAEVGRTDSADSTGDASKEQGAAWVQKEIGGRSNCYTSGQCGILQILGRQLASVAEEVRKTERAKSGSTERQNSVDEDAILSGRRR